MLLVQAYLKSGKTLDDLKVEHGVYSTITNGKIGLNYDQLESSNSDQLACECRGLILRESTYDIVACPMFRFFNLEQKEVAAKIDWSSAGFFEKMDGTCAIVYFDHVLKKWCLGTRGRPEADIGIDGSDITFSMLADQICKRMWNRFNPQRDDISLQDLMEEIASYSKDMTFVFELTSPLNRIVCKYNDYDLTLLAVRNNNTLQEEDPKLWLKDNSFGLATPKEYEFKNVHHMVQVIREWNPEDHEGVVVRDKNYNRIKVKNPSYVAYSHMRDSLSTSIKGCIEVILLGKDDDVVAMMPDAIVDRINKLKPLIKHVLSQTQKDYDEIKDIDDMKYFASKAVLCLWPAALFALKRGKTKDLYSFALGNKPGESKLPATATKTMLELCKKLDPDVGKLDL